MREKLTDALVFLDEAMSALTLEGYRSPTGEPGTWEPIRDIEATIAIELERIDAALGPRGQSMFAPLAERIKQAVIAIEAGRAALKGEEQ